MRLASPSRAGCQPWHSFHWCSKCSLGCKEISSTSQKEGPSLMSENTTQTTRQYLTTPGKGHTTIVTSFRRNGMGVSSPVGTVASQDKLYFMTAADTWKVKRLTNNPRVIVAPGTYAGKVLGPAIEGTARRLTGSELKRERDLLRTDIVGHFWGLIFDLRNPGEKTAVYEISLEASGVDQEMTLSTLPKTLRDWSGPRQLDEDPRVLPSKWNGLIPKASVVNGRV